MKMALNRLCQKERVTFRKDASASIITLLSEQRKTGAFCDVVLVINTCSFYAHKCILAASSPYFRSMFSLPMKEEKDSIINLSQSLYLENETSFYLVLDFMYSGVIEITSSNILDFVKIADFLLLEDLQHFCQDYFLLHGNIVINNCLFVTFLAEQHNLEDVAKVGRSIIECRFFDYFLYSDDILDTPINIFKLILQNNLALNDADSELIESCIFRWVKRDLKERNQYLSNLLEFTNISHSTLLSTSLNENCVTSIAYHISSINSVSCPSRQGDTLNLFRPSRKLGKSKRALKKTPVIFATNANVAMKHFQIYVYNINKNEWLQMPLNTDQLIHMIPPKLGVCAMTFYSATQTLYSFLSYNLPYATDMLRINVLQINTVTGKHSLHTFRHRYYSSECCQTTITDNRKVPPAVICVFGYLCVIGNMEGTGQIYVCDPQSSTYMCYQIPGTRFVSLARVTAKDDRYLYVWCRHRFGHEEYCINKDVSFCIFDVKTKVFSVVSCPPPPGISYSEFANIHALVVENSRVVVHSPGRHSLQLDESKREWIVHSDYMSDFKEHFCLGMMPYRGSTVCSYVADRLYIAENPVMYCTALQSLSTSRNEPEKLKPPPADGLAIATGALVTSVFLRTLKLCSNYDESFVKVVLALGISLEYDTEESATAKSPPSDSSDGIESDGLEYDEDMFEY